MTSRADDQLREIELAATDLSAHRSGMKLIADQLVEGSLDLDATREAKFALSTQIRLARQQADGIHDRLDATGLEHACLEREAATAPAA